MLFECFCLLSLLCPYNFNKTQETLHIVSESRLTCSNIDILPTLSINFMLHLIFEISFLLPKCVILYLFAEFFISVLKMTEFPH